MVADKGKKLKLSEKPEDENADHIDEKLVLSIEKLQEVQDELEKINEEASDKVLEVEQKYNEFLSHPALSELLTEEDQKIFKHLTSLEVEDFKDVKSGYAITFVFSPNPYFEDTKLTKTFTFLDEATKVTATSIKWKEGMGIPNGVNHDKKGNKRPQVEESFFSWFSDSQHKDILEDEIHDEIAEVIKEDLWPNPLTYFNHEADDDEEFDDEEVDEEGKNEDDDSDDDEDDQDDDEDGDEDDGK
ncbi:NAP1-related protein 1-like isoform X2 [Malus sylvestris]|uniref:NAP1-related protein 1 isoform X2 n=1 Tax=Malus domestica TaxID=3750 RepID=UPI0010A9B963|nr:NAP1-related protein 1 isoform X2 [Malus domestica]XP_050121278.1 NAP1-related protein 1-like isoform X2 [Malus sylvestris]